VGLFGLGCCGVGGYEYAHDVRFAPFGGSSALSAEEGPFEQVEWETTLRLDYRVYDLLRAIDVGLRPLFAALLIASGVGLFFLRGWARALALAYAAGSIGFKLVMMAYLVLFALPAAEQKGGPLLYAVEYAGLLLYPALVVLVLLLPNTAAAFRTRREFRERRWRERHGDAPRVGLVVAAGLACLAVGLLNAFDAGWRLLSLLLGLAGHADYFKAVGGQASLYVPANVGVALLHLAAGGVLLLVGVGLLFRQTWARWSAVALAVLLVLPESAAVASQVLYLAPAVEAVQLNSSIDFLPAGYFGAFPTWQNLQTVFVGSLNAAFAAGLACLMLTRRAAAACGKRRPAGRPADAAGLEEVEG
jgi:hypothetical protein